MPLKLINSLLPFLLAIAALFTALPCGIACAQPKAEIDEKLKTYQSGKWCDGFVVDKKGGKYLIEYTWISAERKVMGRKDFRLLFEFEALDFGRTWSSETGSFSVVAALADVTEEHVHLIKRDLSRIKVAREKLSSGDQSYAKRFYSKIEKAIKAGTLPNRTMKLPPIETFDTTKTVETDLESAPLTNAAMGKSPAYLNTFDDAGFGFNMTHANQELVAAIPVGGPEQITLMATHEPDERDGYFFQSRLYWVSLKKQAITGNVDLCARAKPLDYHPVHKRLLTYTEKYTNKPLQGEETTVPSHFTFWELAVNGTEAKPLIRWEAERYSWSDSGGFAKIISRDVVVARTEKHTYAAWKLSEKSQLYVLKPKSFFGAPTVLSPDGKFLVVPEDKRVCIVDAATGDVARRFSSSSGASAVSLNDEGDRLAALNSTGFKVWKLTDPDPSETTKNYSARLIGNSFRSRINWVGNDYILGGKRNRVLFGLDLKLPVWSYQIDRKMNSDIDNPLLNRVVNDRFFYVARPSSSETMIAIGVVGFPGPQVKQLTGNIDRDSLMIIKDGTAISLEVGSTPRAGEVQKWLEEKITANGWKLVGAGESEFSLKASTGVGKTQTVTYERFRTGERTRSPIRSANN